MLYLVSYLEFVTEENEPNSPDSPSEFHVLIFQGLCNCGDMECCLFIFP